METCNGCGQPLKRDWTPTDPTLTHYHAGCRPGAGRLPYRARPSTTPDPFDAREDHPSAYCDCDMCRSRIP